MPSAADIQNARQVLETQRRALQPRFAAAKEAGDTAEMARLQKIARDIDHLLDELALMSLAQIAASLTEIKARIEGNTKAAEEAGSSFGGATLSKIRTAFEAILAESSEETLDQVPQDQLPMAESVAANAEAPAAAAPQRLDVSETTTATDPGPSANGRLVLGEAHMIALWKRSQFPIDGRGVIVFGLRGCRPVDTSGTDFLPEQEIALRAVNYRTMNCTLGQWRPGQGIALFPGSTVPFGSVVQSRVAHGGAGANQLGRGRYANYIAGWHKRSEGPRGHWALLQECAITLQRTADDAEFEAEDRWEVGRIAGDNIHCAFHMGEDGQIPDSSFSSAGCQTVAGTVRKGEAGSERGPWRRFIDPFSRDLGGQKSTEYVLFGGDEAQQAIRTRFADRSIVLRFGSAGPWVEDLQKALVVRRGAKLEVDGEFGPSTFQAVIDFQRERFGPGIDDGIVGGITASELGLTLPAFDFADAIAGGPGYQPRRASMTSTAARSSSAMMSVPAAGPEDRICWGAVVTKKHGPTFKSKVIEISRRLRCDPNHLMAVMAFETGETFAPDKENAAGSGATGLIQFMPDTAIGLGTNIRSLAAMSAIDQLDFVEKHIRSVAGTRPLPTLSDVYMTVLLPSAIGKLESQVLFQAPSKAYTQNKGLDVNKDGRITKAEASSKVQAKLISGMKGDRLG